MKEPSFTWDVFVSHNRQEKPWVREMVAQMRSLGRRVFFDEDSIQPGEAVVSAIEAAVEASRHVLLVLSPAAVESRWVAMETSMSLTEDPNASTRRLIPVLLEPVAEEKIGLSIRRLNRVDLTDPAHARDEYHRLLRAVGARGDDLPDPPSAGVSRRSVPVIAAMGTKGGSGKTTIMLAMAELIASTGKNVLIIDADLQSAGMTKYVSNRARRRPNVWSTLDACFAMQEGGGVDPDADLGAWVVTPDYLRKEARFGEIYLIPAKLDGDLRDPFLALANIQPEERRNAAAMEALEQTLDRAGQIGSPIEAIFVDCGAENNPAVSAGMVLADYGFIVSSPHPEFRHETRAYEAFHKQRYPHHQFAAMHTIVNQATARTESLWQGVPDTYFVWEDARFRRDAAEGKVDFEGVGPCNLYLDVLGVMGRCFHSSHESLLPDPQEIWVKPYLLAMKGFPEATLRKPRYRLLLATTMAFVLCSALLVAAMVPYLLADNTKVEVVVAKEDSVAQARFLAELKKISIPQDLAERVSLESTTLVVQGQLSDNDVRELRRASTTQPYVDALAAAKRSLEGQQQMKLTVFAFAVLIAAGVAGFGVFRHVRLSRQKRLLKAIAGACGPEGEKRLAELVRKLVGEEERHPRLHWLRDAFRTWLSYGGMR